MIPASWFLILSAVLFLIGVLGFFLKRNIIALLLSVEIMLNAVKCSRINTARSVARYSSSLCWSLRQRKPR